MLVKNYKILRKTGRLLNGNESDAGTIYHAVVNGDALCGTKPGRLSGWTFTEGKEVTCVKCLKKLNQTLLLEATRNKDHPHPNIQNTYNFRDYDNNFNKVINKCFRCKFLDDKSDFPNKFCDKTNEGLDYHFCQGQCPLGKWQLYDPKETSILDEVSQNLDFKNKGGNA